MFLWCCSPTPCPQTPETSLGEELCTQLLTQTASVSPSQPQPMLPCGLEFFQSMQPHGYMVMPPQDLESIALLPVEQAKALIPLYKAHRILPLSPRGGGEVQIGLTTDPGRCLLRGPMQLVTLATRMAVATPYELRNSGRFRDRETQAEPSVWPSPCLFKSVY